MYSEDYLLRMFEQMADMLAHAVGAGPIAHIMQLNRRGAHEDALAAIERVWDELFTGPRGMIDAVDARTIAAMLRHPAKLRLAAQLLAEEARARAGLGEAARAVRCYRRARELVLEARAIAPDERDDAVLRELSALAELS